MFPHRDHRGVFAVVITVYTKTECPKCEWTKRKLAERGLTFTEIDITQDEEAANMLRDKGIRQMPYVVTDYDAWSDFRIDRIRDIPK